MAIITGTAGNNTLTGTNGADIISGLGGNDMIIGFVGADIVDGGSGNDTIVLAATSADLNAASDNQIRNVEAISAANAPAGVTLDLSNQSEGFIITGSNSADTITGSAGADHINAGAGDDTIIGFVGADTVNGGAGKDTIVLTATSADLNAAANAQIINVEAISAAGASSGVTINLNKQSDGFTITGSSFADIITGSSGADTIIGFVGADTVDGGAGNDTIMLASTSADLNAASDSQIVNVEAVSAGNALASVTIDLSKQTENFTITGSGFSDVIAGSSGADHINAGVGDDTINGFVGADTVDGGTGIDAIVLTATSADLNAATNAQIINVEAVSAAGASLGVTINLSKQSEGFTISGSSFADIITGSSGNDHINAGAGDDTINGFAGADTVDGGAGFDAIVLAGTSTTLNATTDGQIVNVEAISAATAASGVTIALSSQTEGFAITGSGLADTITGSSGADTINGGIGNDTIKGFVGADTVDGGTGIDTIMLTATSVDLNAAGNNQIINVEAISATSAAVGVTIDLSQQGEGFTITGSGFGDIIAGSSNADTINAGAGDDTILGFTGADTVNGGPGVDTIVLTATSADLNAATNSQISGVEAISAASASAGVTLDVSKQSDGFAITGSGSADSITGSSGADTIMGFVGTDTVDGGGGNDTIMLTATSADLNAAGNDQIVHVEEISAASASSGVTVDLHLQVEGFTITGSVFADNITGTSSADSIKGFSGADTVDGGGGNDAIMLSATSADLNSATDTQIANIETVSATSAVTGVTINLGQQSEGFIITGSGFSDTITGASAADRINAGIGDDTIIGFAGADIVNGGAGTDTIALTGTSADLNSATNNQITNVEAVSAAGASAGVTINLTKQTEAFTITGSDFGDTITGTSAADTIKSGAGDDTIIGFVGADTVDGGADFDTIVLTATSAALNAAADAQIADVEAISAAGAAVGVTIDLSKQSDGFNIAGTGFVDTILGSTGADVIAGFVGADTVDGGTGFDTIALSATADFNAANDSQIMNVEAVSAAGAAAGVTIDLSKQTESLAVTGSSFDDTIIGFTGTDMAGGGTGFDTIVLAATVTDFDPQHDTQIANIEAISAASTAAGVTINLASQTESFTITGTDFADTITGSQGADRIIAGAGDDTIKGFAGSDTVDGGPGFDTIVLTATSADLNAASDEQIVNVEAISAADAPAGVTINLSSQSDGFTITGSAFADSITASAGSDTIAGFVGADTVDGGAGFDTITLSATSADLNASSDAQIVNVEAISAANAPAGVIIDLAGQTEGFTITGSGFADTITGGVGADTMIGGTGNDTYVVNNSGDVVTEKPGDGNDTVETSLATYTLPDNVENLTGTRADHPGQTGQTLIGNALDNDIVGGDGDDTLIGGPGDDILSGGDGSDTFLIGLGDGFDTFQDSGTTGTNSILATADGVAIGLKSGYARDQINLISANGHSGVTIQGETIPNGREVMDLSEVTLSGIVSINGGDSADFIMGSDGDDTIRGGGGLNTLDGWRGNDTFLVAPGDGVTQFIDSGPFLAGTGTEFNRIVATADDTTIAITPFYFAGQGNDPIPGIEQISSAGHSNVTIQCDPWTAAGNSESIFDFSTKDLSGISEVDVGSLINILNGSVVGPTYATIIGSQGDDKIVGGSSNDDLHGAGGNDTIIGGGGNDLLEGGDGSDTYLVGPNDGFDKFYDTGAPFTSIDQIVATADNTVIGLDADTLGGIDGADPTFSGIDTITGDNHDHVSIAIHATTSSYVDFSSTLLMFIELINGSDQRDTIIGSNEPDVINGGGGDDSLNGGMGNDILSGGSGDDFLFGGNDVTRDGTDTAVYAGDVRDYLVTITDATLHQATVQDLAPSVDGNEGTDTLFSIERIQFKNYTIYLDGTDNPVLGIDDTVTVAQGVSTVISAASLLANDFDFDHDHLELDGPADAQNGSVSLNANGDVIFTPTPGFSGTASFRYVVDDFHGSFGSATVTVNVVTDLLPIAQDDSGSTDEDTVLTNAPSLLANDADGDAGDILAIVAVNGTALTSGTPITLPTGARLTINATDGTYSYDPHGMFDYLPAGASTPDIFTYTVSDGRGGTADAAVTITITGVNDPPTAQNDSASADFNTVLTNAPSLLANDTDPDSGETSALVVSAVNGDTNSVGKFITTAKNAQVKVNADGTYVYDPNHAFSASDTDSFTYTVTDPHGASATATVTITISGDTTASQPTLSVSPAAGNENIAIPLSIMAALTDTDGSETLSVRIDGVPSGAMLSAGADQGGGVWLLTPADLTGLTILPPPNSDLDFTLGVHAISTESNGGATAHADATLQVTVDPVAEAPIIYFNNFPADPAIPATPEITEDSQVFLNVGGVPLAALVDTDGSESLDVTITETVGEPGVIITDGNHRFTTTAGHFSVNVSNWDLTNISVGGSGTSDADFALLITATATEADGGSSATSQALYEVSVDSEGTGVQDVFLLEDLVSNGSAQRFDGPIVDLDGDGVADFTGFGSSVSGILNFREPGPGLIIGASDASPNALSLAGAAYVYGPGVSDHGVSIFEGGNALDHAGMQVSDGGDFNHDGFGDFLIETSSGADLLVSTPLSSEFTLPAETNLNGPSASDPTAPSEIKFDASNTAAITSVSSAGDVNGDGFSDVILGATSGNEAFVVYGHAGIAPASLSQVDLSALNGVNGSQIVDNGPFIQTGATVTSAGDMNGDGYDDIAIGAPNGLGPGAVYVLYGGPSGFGPQFDLANINGNNGFVANSSDPSLALGVGTSIKSAGDINGDGFDDLVIGAPFTATHGDTGAGVAYVVFGGQDGNSTIDLATLNGNNGFEIDGADANDQAGIAVAGAGDFNADGFDDIVIGTQNGGDNFAHPRGGETYVVYGQGSPFGAIDLASLPASEGVRFDGGFSIQSVSGAGDLNGDGFDDILIGAPHSGIAPSGVNGEVYAVDGTYGVGNYLTGTVNPDNISATADDQTLLGGDGNDSLSGNFNRDVLKGGTGDDDLTIFNGTTDTTKVNGGAGFDTLHLDGPSDLDLTALNANAHYKQITGVEQIDMTNGQNNVLTMDYQDAVHLSREFIDKAVTFIDGPVSFDDTIGADRLVVNGDVGDSVDLSGGGGWVKSIDTAMIDGNDYNIYSHLASQGLDFAVFIQNTVSVLL